MKQASTLMGTVTDLFDSAKTYLGERLDLEILQGADKISRLFAMVATLLIGASLALLLLILICMGAVVLINKWIGSDFLGYFIMAGLILITMLVLFTAGKKKIRFWLLNYILSNMEDDA